jgi:hypothetical protein
MHLKTWKTKDKNSSVLFVHMAISWGQWKFKVILTLQGYGHVI